VFQRSTVNINAGRGVVPVDSNFRIAAVRAPHAPAVTVCHRQIVGERQPPSTTLRSFGDDIVSDNSPSNPAGFVNDIISGPEVCNFCLLAPIIHPGAAPCFLRGLADATTENSESYSSPMIGKRRPVTRIEAGVVHKDTDLADLQYNGTVVVRRITFGVFRKGGRRWNGSI